MSQKEIIAKRYADGLALRAAETGGVAAARRDLHILADAVNPRTESYTPEFAEFLASPRVGAEEKAAAAATVAEKLGVSGAVSDFLALLVRRGRAGLLPRIAACFDGVAGELTGERTGTVETARRLTPQQLERLETALSSAFGGPVRLRQRVDASLVAGAKVTVGGSTVDGSVLGRWSRLRERLGGGVAAECVRVCDLLDMRERRGALDGVKDGSTVE